MEKNLNGTRYVSDWGKTEVEHKKKRNVSFFTIEELNYLRINWLNFRKILKINMQRDKKNGVRI